MPYSSSVHAQDSKMGRVGVILDAVSAAASAAGDYSVVDIAVAYASAKGVRLLQERLDGETWRAAGKRFLVSIDFGFSQARALEVLHDLENAEVRIPNGRAVLSSPTLQPPAPFHAKTYAFRSGPAWPELRSLVVGSANLTASALSTGAEAVIAQTWTDNSFPSEAWRHLQSAQPISEWFEDAWDRADLLSDVIDEYRLRRRHLPKAGRLRDDKSRATRTFIASPASHEISGSLPVQLANARSLWVNASSIIQNRGQAQPGNQLNTPRGTRVFFGFNSRKVPVDTTLGNVQMRVAGREYVERSVRFANNGMDIVGLPIPEQNGIETYLDTILVFSREPGKVNGLNTFTLTVTDLAGLDELKGAAANSVDLAMHGGRQYGLLF